jgi:hypothetical protein
MEIKPRGNLKSKQMLRGNQVFFPSSHCNTQGTSSVGLTVPSATQVTAPKNVSTRPTELTSKGGREGEWWHRPSV